VLGCAAAANLVLWADFMTAGEVGQGPIGGTSGARSTFKTAQTTRRSDSGAMDARLESGQGWPRAIAQRRAAPLTRPGTGARWRSGVGGIENQLTELHGRRGRRASAARRRFHRRSRRLDLFEANSATALPKECPFRGRPAATIEICQGNCVYRKCRMSDVCGASLVAAQMYIPAFPAVSSVS